MPDYDISFVKGNYKKRIVIQNRIQQLLYKFVRKPYVLRFFEKYPKLQMRVGRYVYTFPNRVLIYKFLKTMRDLVKRKQ